MSIINEKQIIFNKYLNEYKKTSKISECFYHKKSECKGKIKQTHSLQKNGRLSLIEGDVKGNQVIYTFTSYIPNENTPFSDLKPIGKNEASTFFGFCDYHDTLLFSPIENSPFDSSERHCFLHSYRAFAHSYHRKNEGLKAYDQNSSFMNLILSRLGMEYIDTIKTANIWGQNDLIQQKKEIDKIIENKTYGGLVYFIYKKKGLYPIACSSIISPFVSYRNKAINLHMNQYKPFSNIMLTVLPDVNQTIAILACFPNDKNAIMLLNELKNLKNLEKEYAITSLLIALTENTFFSPVLWKRLGESGRYQLLKELTLNSPPQSLRKFFLSKINFFDSKFLQKDGGGA
jgi:hypothetical protein